MYERYVFTQALESLALVEPADSVIEPERALQLLELGSGYHGWKIVFPGSVIVSQGAAQLFGLTAGAEPLPLQDLVKTHHVEDRGKLLAMIAQALDGRRGFHCRLRVEQGGHVRMVETLADLRIRQGKVVGLFGLSRDVTADIERELALSARLRFVQEMVEGMPCPVVMLDDKFKVMDCSITWLKAHRFVERREVVGKTLTQLFGQLPNDVINELERGLKGQVVKTKRTFVVPSTSQPTQFQTVITPWFISDRKVGGVVVTIGWSEIAVTRAPTRETAVEPFDGSLLELLKTVT